jgi:hypothetical protein
MKRATFAALACLYAVTSAQAQNLSADDLNNRLIHRRAVEAIIWGMPAVNYDLMLQAMLNKTEGKVNEFIYWSRPSDWKNQTLTPNPDTIYVVTFFNTKDVGPIVIEVPPAVGGSFAANIDDVWQAALEDAGPEGADQGKGGKYLILPPDYSSNPPAGYFVLPSQTYGGFALLRSNLPGRTEADFAKSVAYAKQFKIYPLAQAANPPPTTFTDVMGILYDSTIPFDLRFFQSLDRIVQGEPWQERDRAMIDQLRSLGIEKGKPFNPDAKTQEILNAAAREARALLELRYDTVFPPYFESTYWHVPAQPEAVQGQSTRYANRDAYAIDARGLTYTYGFIGIKRLGTAQFYLMAIKDRDGQNFSGANTYRLVVPADAPVRQYWSVTAYDRATHALIRDMPRASAASQSPELTKNPDGTVDLYFGPKAPAGKKSNWVPTDPSGQFEVMFRLYGPEKPLFDKTWKLPDLEKTAAQ